MNRLDLLYCVLAGVSAPLWARKSRAGWGERFGRVEPLATPNGRPRILLHAVSVGEVNSLRTLVPKLAEQVEVVVCATTDTGIERARGLYQDVARVVRYPLDFSASVGRFLDSVKPDAVALVELEIWPNFVRACERRDIPICVINGRLSERSYKGYRRIRPWIGKSFGALDFAGVQDGAYAERFESMGVDPGDCLVTGSMKWDSAPIVENPRENVPGALELAREMGIDLDRPVIVGGSTGPGEEALLHEACPRGAQLVCATRKPERFDEAAAALPGCVRRSSRTPAPPGTDRFLLDTIGELRAAYALADVVVVGRSFGDLYGSDPIEPCSLGRATIAGPRMSDFAWMTSELESDGAIVRATRDSLPGELQRLLSDSQARAKLGEAARVCIRERQGASARHVELLVDLASRREAQFTRAGFDR
jgi:3-deoxy-D-manno-octulosonic-acid transferase